MRAIAVVAISLMLTGCWANMGHPQLVSVSRVSTDNLIAQYGYVYTGRTSGDDWLKIDFRSDVDYARVMRLTDFSIALQAFWCSEGRSNGYFARSPVYTGSVRVVPVPGMTIRRDGVAYILGAFIPVRRTAGAQVSSQLAGYDLEHPRDDICLTVFGANANGGRSHSAVMRIDRVLLAPALSVKPKPIRWRLPG